MRVSDVMTKGAECARPDDSLAQAAERMKMLDVGCLPVCDNDKVVGIVTDRDITVRATADGLDPSTARVRDVMTPGIVSCQDDQDVAEAAKIMKEKQIRRLPVMNRARRLVGIVSLGDLAINTHDDHLVGQALEKISEPAGALR
jgi:CBS domain-containing protein